MTEEQTNEENRSILSEPETVREQRLASIFDAREQVRDVRTKIEGRRFGSGEFRKNNAAGIYRGVIETYFQELEPVFLANPEGKELWENRDFGEVVVGPPMNKDGEVKVKQTGPNKYIDLDRIKGLNPMKYSLEGLSCLFELQNPIKHTFEIKYSTPTRRATTTTVTGKAYIEKRTLDSMYRAANRYLREIGIGLNLEEDKGPKNVEDADF